MKNEYAVLVNSQAIRRDMYAKLELRIVQIKDGQLRNPDSDDAFSDLVFRCQWDTDKSDNRTYGWEIVYRDCYRVDLAEAKRMLKTLSRVEKISNSFAVTPVTFGQFVALTAKALGIESARKESRYSVGGSSYAENTYITLDLQALQYAVDNLIQESREPQTV